METYDFDYASVFYHTQRQATYIKTQELCKLRFVVYCCGLELITSTKTVKDRGTEAHQFIEEL